MEEKYFLEIQKILDENIKVSEKEQKLKKLEKEFSTQLTKAQKDIHKGFKYCKYCNEYYKEKAFEYSFKKEVKEVLTFHDLSDWGEDKYEKKDVLIKQAICPLGHTIEEEIIY